MKKVLSPSHTWQLFLEIQSNFHILVAKQVAKKMAKKLLQVRILAIFLLATWQKFGLSDSISSAFWGAKCQWIDIKHA